MPIYKNSPSRLLLDEEYSGRFKEQARLQSYTKALSKTSLSLYRHEFDEKICQYHTAQDEIKRVEEISIKLADEERKLSVKIDKLTKQMEKSSIATDVINSFLRYIYHTDEKMQIVDKGEFFSINSQLNGYVLPKAISTGERNILALCYFFASTLNNDGTHQEEPELYVIDDPVSSFDKEIQLGVMSLIKFKLLEILKNPNAKIIIMTHNLMNFLDFERQFVALNNAKKSFDFVRVNCLSLELVNRKTKKLKTKNTNRYSEMLNTIYEYADGNKEELSPYIGNIMRRVMEAFGSFEYKMGFEEFQDAENIDWGKHRDTPLVPALRCAMIRICLHNESHQEFGVRYNIDTYFLETLSRKEAQTCAKAIIVMLYVLNPNHIKMHLCNVHDEKNRMNRIRQIEDWQNNIIQEVKYLKV